MQSGECLKRKNEQEIKLWMHITNKAQRACRLWQGSDCIKIIDGGFCSIMKKNFTLWLAVSAVIMLVLPWLAVTLVKSDAGMAACFILFFAVNPIYSVVIGFFAGKDKKHLWSLPVISAVLFLIGTWVFFDMGETAFILYAVVYLALGIVTLLISMFIRKKLKG